MLLVIPPTINKFKNQTTRGKREGISFQTLPSNSSIGVELLLQKRNFYVLQINEKALYDKELKEIRAAIISPDNVYYNVRVKDITDLLEIVNYHIPTFFDKLVYKIFGF